MSFFLKDTLDIEKFEPLEEVVVEDRIIGEKENILITDNIIIKGDFVNNGNLIFQNGFILDGGRFQNNGSVSFMPIHSDENKFERIIKITLDKNISNDFEFTGFFTEYDIKTSFFIRVEGPENSSIAWSKEYEVELGKKIESPFYFSSNEGLTANSVVKKGDGLYCNPSFLKTNLYEDWRLILRY